jgi:leucyl/phenylalanyl-tRNA--protein transferase
MNLAFPQVLEACAAPRARGRGTWLGPEMKHAYHELHQRGFAQSVEVWRGGQLAGGMYGVSLGRVFFGESMFSRIEDGSKIAFHYLCAQLAAWRFDLLDCQISSPHLSTLGAVEIPRDRFLARLRDAVAAPGRTGRWQFEIEVPSSREHRA